MDYTGKSRDGLYEPVLAESEREAVADLLQYLENVLAALSRIMYALAHSFIARGDGFLLWRTFASSEHPRILGQCRSTTQRKFNFC